MYKRGVVVKEAMVMNDLIHDQKGVTPHVCTSQVLQYITPILDRILCISFR